MSHCHKPHMLHVGRKQPLRVPAAMCASVPPPLPAASPTSNAAALAVQARGGRSSSGAMPTRAVCTVLVLLIAISGCPVRAAIDDDDDGGGRKKYTLKDLRPLSDTKFKHEHYWQVRVLLKRLASAASSPTSARMRVAATTTGGMPQSPLTWRCLC